MTEVSKPIRKNKTKRVLALRDGLGLSDGRLSIDCGNFSYFSLLV